MSTGTPPSVAEPLRGAATAEVSGAHPLAVDMDGSLLLVDTLYETFAAALFADPLATLCAFARLTRGVAPFKRRLSEIAPLDVETLPVRDDLVAWLQAERAAGRRLALATAADDSIAQGVAARVGLFETVHASDGVRNLKSSAKAAALEASYPGGFAYVGDSDADLAVWKRAASGVIVSGGAGFERRARAAQPTVERVFQKAGPTARVWLRAARPHQWSKNVLVLIPVALGWNTITPEQAFWALPALLLICGLASLTYFINDIADLSSDRRHWSKAARPFAAGALPVRDGLLAAVAGIPLILGLGLMISPAVAACLTAYLAITLAYSFGLKRIPFLDTFLIGCLFTVRLLLGVAATGQAGSAWLYAFAMFFFFSLALAKRHTELLRARETLPQGKLEGRGYHVEDREVTLAFGIAASMASVLLLVIYLVEEVFKLGAYPDPQWLWVTPGAIFLWTARIWLLAHRGLMNDDPVVFALRDRVSLALGAAVAAGLVLAVL